MARGIREGEPTPGRPFPGGGGAPGGGMRTPKSRPASGGLPAGPMAPQTMDTAGMAAQPMRGPMERPGLGGMMGGGMRGQSEYPLARILREFFASQPVGRGF